MKRLSTIMICLLAMMSASLSAKAQEVTITLMPGWTWISVPSTETMDFATALGSFTPAVGDRIKSQWGNATYKGNGEWRGQISEFYPGYGYKYYSTRQMPVSVTFNAQQPAPQVVVNTSEPMLITAVSAMCGGEVTVNDGTYILVKGLCWATHENPTTNDDFYQEAESGVGSFAISMTALNIGTTYYARAYAVTPNGTVYGDQKTFTTRNGIPTLTTAEVTDITGENAISGGDITEDGGLSIIARGVCWSTSPNPTIADSHTSNGSGTGSFSSSITGLNVSTTYYVRAYASTAAGTGYGDEMSFTTRSGIPTLTTAEVTDISVYSATCGGTVTDDGGLTVITRGVCWSTVSNPTIDDSYTDDGNGTGSFSSGLTDLNLSTTYYVRAYATTSAGTGYGEQKIFVTRNGIPTLTTAEVTGIMANSATCGGTVTDDGGLEVITKGVCWSMNPNPSMSDSHSSDGTGLGDFVSNLTSLTPNTTYYVRAYATNSYVTVYGNQRSFTTELPSYTVTVSSNPTNGGTVTGGSTYVQGQSCSVQAVANTGYTFFNWTENDSVVSTEANYTFIVNADRNLVANFTLQSFTIDVSANPSQGGSVSGGDNYNYGQSCTVSATANMGYNFSNWTENDSVVSTDTDYTFIVDTDRTLVANFTYAPSWSNGVLPGAFSVSATQQVNFSQGNLQYIGSANTPYWKFAENQWDCIGSAQNGAGQGKDRDLFGWGTSGWNNGNYYYRPWDTSWDSEGRYRGFGYGPYNGFSGSIFDLTGNYANSDWGVYNSISNGGNHMVQWRTLTGLEWNYVFNTRTTSSGIRYAKANVNDVNGVILLPDAWNADNYNLNNTNSSNASFDSNILTASQWSILEQAGAVFLPAAGYRSVYDPSQSSTASVYQVGSNGYYWSVSSGSNNNYRSAKILSFSESMLNSDSYTIYLCNGYSVRLARDAE